MRGISSSRRASRRNPSFLLRKGGQGQGQVYSELKNDSPEAERQGTMSCVQIFVHLVRKNRLLLGNYNRKSRNLFSCVSGRLSRRYWGG